MQAYTAMTGFLQSYTVTKGSVRYPQLALYPTGTQPQLALYPTGTQPQLALYPGLW